MVFVLGLVKCSVHWVGTPKSICLLLFFLGFFLQQCCWFCNCHFKEQKSCHTKHLCQRVVGGLVDICKDAMNYLYKEEKVMEE